MADLSTVTLEADLGPIDLAFGYCAVGDPTYSDVPRHGPWCPTEGAAEHYGARLLAVGNWRSFTVEKRYFPSPEPATTEEARRDG